MSPTPQTSSFLFTGSAGSVHGRFQPLHNGHLEYIEAALKRVSILYIGITQYRKRHLVPVEPADAVHRAQPQSNPLTFFERLQLIEQVLVSRDVSIERFRVIPFPIEEPLELPDFLPTSVPIFTTIYDSWNEQKIVTLRRAGYSVESLWQRETKEVTGSEIRRLMRENDDSWRKMVPEAGVRLLLEMHVADRLRAVASREAGD